jgi:hypothetical protein
MRQRPVDTTSPIHRDVVRGTGGKAGGKFTFTSADNLTPGRVEDPYGDMDYHEDYWLRVES